jgi:hypothetical protein
MIQERTFVEQEIQRRLTRFSTVATVPRIAYTYGVEPAEIHRAIAGEPVQVATAERLRGDTGTRR